MVVIIASGMTVYEALEAADQLKVEGISARVVDMFTIKPIDAQCIVESAQKTGAIVTAENHNIINGLGSAVAEVLCENLPIPLERVGVQDEFGEVGPQEYLMERFGLTAKTICEKAKKAIARKGK
jgi:transketolase